MSISILERSSEPSKIDTAPYGSICKVKKENISLYLLTSKNEEMPQWHLITILHDSVSHDVIQFEIQKILNSLKES